MKKYVCKDVDFDEVFQTCADPQWQDDTGILPPMSGSEGALIAGAIALVWVAGASVRWFIRGVRS